MTPARHNLAAYVACVTASAFALVIVLATNLPLTVPPEAAAFALFSLLLLVSEMRPLQVVRDGEPEGVSLSGLFACALLLRYDVGLVVAVQAAVTLLHGAIHRVAWWKRGFNLAQYAWSLVAAATVFHLFAPGPRLEVMDSRHLMAAIAAVTTYFLVNNTLMGVAIAFLHDEPLIATVLEDLPFQASINGVAAVLAPLMVVIADANLLLVPALLVPLGAVQRAAGLARLREHRDRHDELTELVNAQHFRRLVRDALASAPPDYGRLAMMMIDLDDFAEVNDTLGHDIGDTLLRQFSERLTGALRPCDVVARFGGDEFAVLLPGLNATEAREAADHVLAAIRDAFDVGALTFELRASVGVALYPRDGADVDRLLQHADVALSLAKRNGAGVELYNAERDWHSPRRLQLLGELRHAVDERQLVLHYQPKASLLTGEITGFEALLRWPHAELGRVAPDEFIPLAERSGLIRQVTRFVLEEAARTASGWRDLGLSLPLSVNISARDLDDPTLPDTVAQLLSAWSLPAAALVIEITETALMSEPEGGLEVLQALRALGIRISMDDFGTGYASLALLKRLPIDEIKIDRQFIAGLASDPDDVAIVSSIIGLARHLGIAVVAEGVEVPAAWTVLADLGCASAQGYFVGRPRVLDTLDLRPVALPLPAPREGSVIRLTPRAASTAT